MENLNKTAKIFLFLTSTACILWLGGYISRHLVVYQFFEPENLDLRSIYNQQNLTIVVQTIAPLFVFNLVTFLLFLITFIIFVLLSKIKLKKEGWFFISILAVIITAPFELYLSYLDYKIIDQIYLSNFNADIIDRIKDRLTSLSSFSLIEIFTYIGIIFLFVFRPLRQK